MARWTLIALAILALASPAAADAAAPAGFVGMVSEDTLAGSSAYRSAQLANMHARGVTFLRQTFDWATIEKKRGRYDFSRYDRLVRSAAAAQIQVMPILFNPPKFRSSRTARSKLRGTYPPKHFADMGAFAAAAAARYGPNGTFWRKHPSLPAVPVRSWQVWNEPNLPVYWRPAPSAKAYVRLLSVVSQALRAVDPTAEIVSAGLPDSRSGIPLKTYLASMLSAGAATWMTTLAVNPYSARPLGVVNILKKARHILDANGAAAVQMRATELGWSDVGPGSRFRAGRKGQATNIRRLIAALGAERTALKLNGFVYFNWKDAPPYPGFYDFWGLHTGLLTRAGKGKPALAAFSKAVAALDG